jgi:hypothetical protein
MSAFAAMVAGVVSSDGTARWLSDLRGGRDRLAAGSGRLPSKMESAGDAGTAALLTGLVNPPISTTVISLLISLVIACTYFESSGVARVKERPPRPARRNIKIEHVA